VGVYVNKSIRGQGLIEVLVGLGVLAAGALAIMQVSSYLMVGSKNIESSANEYRDIMAQLNAMLSNTTFCGNTLRKNGTLNGTTKIKLYDAAGSGAVFLDPADPTTNQFQKWTQNSTGAKSIWTVSSLNITPVNGNWVYSATGQANPAVIDLRMTRPVNNSGAVETRRASLRNISVFVNSAQQIQSCSTLTYGTDDQPIPPCPNQGEAYSPQGGSKWGMCARLTCPKQGEQFRGYKIANGYDTHGNVVCCKNVSRTICE